MQVLQWAQSKQLKAPSVVAKGTRRECKNLKAVLITMHHTLTKPVLKMEKATRTAVIFISYSFPENVWYFIKYIAQPKQAVCLGNF